MTIKHLETI